MDDSNRPGPAPEKPDSYAESICHWWRGDRQALSGWWRRSGRYWWPRERQFLLKMLIVLALLGLVMAPTFRVASIAYAGIIHESERRVLPLAERAFAALDDEMICEVVDHQNWRQTMTEKLLILALIAGVLLHAVLSYREIKEWIERSIDRMRERPKELKNEKKYHVLAKVAGITGAILITVQAYAILSGSTAA